MKTPILARALFASRWLLTPFYVALIVALLTLLGKDALYAYDLATRFLTLTASLVVLVIFSGYANFVSRVGYEAHEDLPRWMIDIDFSELKLKLLSSIVAIAGIKLLEAYMKLDHENDRDLAWQLGLFGAFVIGLLLVSIADALHRHFDDSDH